MSNYIYPTLGVERNLPLYLVGIECDYQYNNVVRKDGFPFYQIGIVNSGEGIFRYQDKEWNLNNSCVLIISPDSHYEIYSENCCVLDRIIFSGADIDNFLRILNISDHAVEKMRNPYKIHKQFGEIVEEAFKDSVYSGYKTSSMLYNLLIELSVQKNLLASKSDEIKVKNIEPIVSYIESYYSKDLTLEELSSMSGYSPQYICRLFKECLNTRPFEFIAKVRIKHAKEMLLDTNDSICLISDCVGFNDCSYFCALFKRYEMISPTEFRSLYKKDI